MTQTSLLLLYAETPLHPGTGSAMGAVDLPVAREKATGLPFVPGSSLKGILRDAARHAHNTTDGVRGPLWQVFGGDTAHASEAAGALALTDARLVAFPLRSLAGLFAWTTCPAVLERFVRDGRVARLDHPVVEAASGLCNAARELRGNDKKALVSPASPLRVGQSLVFEEFDYQAEESEAVAVLGTALDRQLGGEEMRLKSHLAVISDNAFAFSTRYATEVSARIKLDPESKTVAGGALFYQEFLPAGTLLAAVAMAEQPRRVSKEKNGEEPAAERAEAAELANAGAVLDYVGKALEAAGNVLQVGGNASIGKGLCSVRLLATHEAKEA